MKHVTFSIPKIKVRPLYIVFNALGYLVLFKIDAVILRGEKLFVCSRFWSF